MFRKIGNTFYVHKVPYIDIYFCIWKSFTK